MRFTLAILVSGRVDSTTVKLYLGRLTCPQALRFIYTVTKLSGEMVPSRPCTRSVGDSKIRYRTRWSLTTSNSRCTKALSDSRGRPRVRCAACTPIRQESSARSTTL